MSEPIVPTTTICLSMIVRDEAHVVAEALQSVAPYLDHWVVVDTGSTDETIEVVQRFFAERGIPGEVVQRPWRDFGHNRSEALALCAGRADYAWVLDADDRFVGSFDRRALAEDPADSYLLRYGTDFTYWRNQLFRLDKGWRYEGVVHEYAVCADPHATSRRIEGRYHVESRRLGARGGRRETYERDARLLRAEAERDPANPRTAFYLAQSLLDAGDVDGAIEWYAKRAAMGGWTEEQAYALLQEGRARARRGDPWPDVLATYLASWNARPTRADALYEIARHYRLADEFTLAHLFASRAAAIPFPDADLLFVARDVHEWRALDELAVSAYYAGYPQESLDACTELLSTRALPEPERERVVANRDFAVAQLANSFVQYPEEIVAAIGARPAAEPGVTLTVTTCRRLDLFERTINSFLNCCLDRHRITRWICVDDASSAEDRARMEARYPFFEFVWRDGDERGHAQGMNRILDLIDSPYWFHLEDDWQFVVPDHYVAKLLAVLDHDPSVDQVLLNRNYAETLADAAIVGGFVRVTDAGLRYRLHGHAPTDSEEYRAFFAQYPPGTLANVWWPHYSLRPALVRMEAVRDVGRFDPQAEHFELEFAQRWTERGHQSAFLDAVYSVHIGRLTTERHSGAPNAYVLNEQPQFRGPVGGDAVHTEVRVINLARRADRWDTFVAGVRERAGEDFVARLVRHDAVDGRALGAAPAIEHLFRGNDFGNRRSWVGCALSHLAVWNEAGRAESGQFLVLEDDATLVEGFAERFDELMESVRDGPGYDLLLLGYLPWGGDGEQVVAAPGEVVQAQPMDWSKYLGGLFAYVVTPAGARAMLARAERDGIHHGIDWFVMKQNPDLRAMRAAPALAMARHAREGSEVDSDVQYDGVALW